MCEGTERSAGAITILLNVVALRRLVNLRVELLLGARVAVLATVPRLAVGRLPPFVSVLHIRTRRRSVRGKGNSPHEIFFKVASMALLGAGAPVILISVFGAP